jgi:hypothetical protein
LQVLLRNIKPRSKLLYLKEKLLLCFTGAGKSTPPLHLREPREFAAHSLRSGNPLLLLHIPDWEDCVPSLD